MNDLLKYVDVFYGNGETDRFFDDGLASKWFYIKALCGNTTPHAVLPFGKMSVGAYSGGYPTGYGAHYPNTCGGIQKLSDMHMVKGFSHIHHSGTGGIRYYYNYAVTTPFYGDDITTISECVPLKDEEACPGYYKATLRGVSCEMSVDGGVAIHRYTFGTIGGRIAVDFSNNGLDSRFGEYFSSVVREPKLEKTGSDTVAFSGVFSGVRLYFCVKAEGAAPKINLFEEYKESKKTVLSDMAAPYGAVIRFEGDVVLLRVGYSTVSYENAQREVEKSSVSFETAVEKARLIWNRYLSAIKIHSNDEGLKQKFYSNLYHSLIKPANMFGETVLGVAGETVTDFATLWDQYKTALPLIYMCYPEMGECMAKGIINISRTLGKIPCSFGLCDVFPCEEQAKMLGILMLCDAYHMGIRGVEKKEIEECTKRELARKDFCEFLSDGYFERYTHILDTTDACLCVAEITENAELHNRLTELAKNWHNAYANDGLMSEDSKYYEGDRYTYSFRIQKNMEERVALAGGKENFARMLDNFFGFGEESVKQLTYLGADCEIVGKSYHRFEGFNNECDMETPYAYIYADRHDRLCEIISECVSRSFGFGRSGLPGNNDSGGLSSLFVWNTLGIFPVSGSGEFLIGAPQVDSAEISLHNGKCLKIEVNRKNINQIYVDSVFLNGQRVENYKIPAKDLMQGGVLQFFMK